MIPLKDANPSCLRPYINWLLIASCIIIFIWQISGNAQRFRELIYWLGFIPEDVIKQGAYYPFLTSMFLHGDMLHLGGNMLYLYIFGDNIEDMCGHLTYLVFYLISGFIGSFAFLLTSWGSSTPAVGASGAISGVLGAYIMLFPKVRIMTALPIGFFIRVFYIPAYAAIGIWFLYQIILAIVGMGGGIAYWAHIGGFLGGLVLGKVFARRKHLHPYFRSRQNC